MLSVMKLVKIKGTFYNSNRTVRQKNASTHFASARLGVAWAVGLQERREGVCSSTGTGLTRAWAAS